MNRFRNYVLMAVGFAVLVMVVGVFSAGPAIAQAVRAALVSNVDDPGRNPYKAHIVSSGICASGGGCQGSASRRIPDGKRLVITNVTGQVFTGAPGGTQIILYINSPTPFVTGETTSIPMIYSGQAYGQNGFGFNQQVLLVYDPGAGPFVQLFTYGAGTASSTLDLVMSGYLLDCQTAPCGAINP